MRRALASSAALSLLGSALLLGPALGQDPSAPPTATGEQPHPAHIHTGTCAEIGGIVEPLRDITYPSAPSSPGTDASPAPGPSPGLTPAPEVVPPAAGPDTARAQVSVRRVDMSIAEMLRGDHAINAHESAAAMGNYIACGDIVGAPGDRNLVIPLVEQNGSGFRGVAFLHADGQRTVVFLTLVGGGASSVPVEPGPEASADPLASPSAASLASPAAGASAAP